MLTIENMDGGIWDTVQFGKCSVNTNHFKLTS